MAAQFLQKKRYTLLATNYRCRYGEIDLIVSNKKFLVFVEVKLRKTDRFANAYEYVDVFKQSRIRTTASMYLSQYPTHLQPRFDVIEIYAPAGINTVDPLIRHLEGAFE